MNLLLMRHGDAEYPSGYGSDAARKLTDWGRIQAEKMGMMLARSSMVPEVIVCSPYHRAVETAGIVANASGCAAHPMEDSRCTPAASIENLAAVVHDHRDAETLLLVGHMPSMGQFAGEVIASGLSLQLSTAAVVAVHVDRPHPTLRGTLLWMVAPQVL